MTEDIYKKKYYQLLKKLSIITGKLENERCPPLVRSCCGGCIVLKNTLNEIKKEQLEKGEEWT